MARYKLTETGVLDTITSAHIPNSLDNRHWDAYQDWLLAGNTPDPIDVVDPWTAIRGARDLLLQQSDFTQLIDAPLDSATKTLFATYRQELRDITLQADPMNIIWPTKPV